MVFLLAFIRVAACAESLGPDCHKHTTQSTHFSRPSVPSLASGSAAHFVANKLASTINKIRASPSKTYLSCMVTYYRPSRNLRFQSANLLTDQTVTSSSAAAAFSAAAPKLWNTIHCLTTFVRPAAFQFSRLA